MRSKRNKTIDFSLEEASPELLEQILQPIKNIRGTRDKIINGDSFKVMKKLSPHQVSLALIDPPYNLNKQYDGLNFKKMTTEEYQEYTQKWINLLKPLLKDNASVYVFSDWATSISLAPVLAQNFTIQNRITWQREKGRGSQKNWKNGMEDIWFLTVDPNKYTFNVDRVKQRRQVVAPYKKDGVAKDWQATSTGNFRDTMPSNFWDDISIPYWSMPENTGHPTQKPEKLLAKIILASSNPGDFIFDPFAGSGSSLVTAAKLNRHYLGIEQSLLYCAWGQYRLNQVKNDQTIQGYTDGVFWERNTLAAQRKVMRHKN
ncbi:site-specific DNA-methyltransferase [Limosilactobacillus sp. STM2_1]|uniref:Methyltransferase n=1 Tax=Limosilactobacillus rudii TaxID=2759755 RepID=A0A7W3UMH8_9LACO|nr:site-specific DNA-methyltransferase [Limosilactobacillus rudii]MBB1079027.1 site-specific DNA-methyltransferase [Limosilactobacillus rudii]MBB1098287.1 site-specific DNA-methyltransferase [Limosilactobacillus rudii]MCD7135295.1 site-specific DNA-methyltransferase [Limosilactobacillus rudii]